MIKTLCLAGGGIKVLPYIGILKILSQKELLNFNMIRKIIGVSSGSIIALMLSIGYTVEEIEFFFINFDLSKVIPETNSSELIFNYGMEDSSKLNNVLKTLFIKKNLKLNYSFLDLYNDTKKELIVSVSNLTKKKVEYWSYCTKPDMPIIQSIMISSCFPLVFKPIKINNNYYLDGGILDNFPIQLGDPKETLGLITVSSKQNNFENFFDYFSQIINLSISSRDIHKINHFKKYHIITIKNNLQVFDFNISKEEKERKIDYGEKIGLKFTKKFIKKKYRRFSI